MKWFEEVEEAVFIYFWGWNGASCQGEEFRVEATSRLQKGVTFLEKEPFVETHTYIVEDNKNNERGKW